MPRLLMFSILVFTSCQTYAADSWFDSALDFFGFGEEKEEAVPVSTPESTTDTLTKVATSALESDLVTSGLTNMITNQLGVSDTQAQGGLGSLFGLAKSTLGSQEFSQLSEAVPEMDTLLAAAPALSENAKGLSSLMGSAGKYGKTLQAATQAYSQFETLGIGVEQIPQYVGVTNEFLKSQGSDDALTLFQKGVGALLSQEE